MSRGHNSLLWLKDTTFENHSKAICGRKLPQFVVVRVTVRLFVAGDQLNNDNAGHSAQIYQFCGLLNCCGL